MKKKKSAQTWFFIMILAIAVLSFAVEFYTGTTIILLTGIFTYLGMIYERMVGGNEKSRKA